MRSNSSLLALLSQSSSISSSASSTGSPADSASSGAMLGALATEAPSPGALAAGAIDRGEFCVNARRVVVVHWYVVFDDAGNTASLIHTQFVV